MKVEIKSGDLVRDNHYGVGLVEHVNEDLYIVTAIFAASGHLAPEGRIRLMGRDQVGALKLISRPCEKSEKSFE